MFMIYPVGSFSNYPRQTYNPADLATAGHLSFRARIARAARWWGLGEDDTEEAVSQVYLYWLSRDYATTDIPRGDHSRAMASTLAYAKKSHFHGFTGQRRQARGKRVERGSDGLPVKQSVRRAGEAEMAYRQRRREAMIPGPDCAAVARDTLENRPGSQTSRKVASLAQRLGMHPSDVIDVAFGFNAE
jgi:hypothetical protein